MVKQTYNNACYPKVRVYVRVCVTQVHTQTHLINNQTIPKASHLTICSVQIDYDEVHYSSTRTRKYVFQDFREILKQIVKKRLSNVKSLDYLLQRL